jgi:hypothetical protein
MAIVEKWVSFDHGYEIVAGNHGATFEFTRVELEGLVKAHFHIAGYCDASKSMLGNSVML